MANLSWQQFVAMGSAETLRQLQRPWHELFEIYQTQHMLFTDQCTVTAVFCSLREKPLSVMEHRLQVQQTYWNNQRQMSSTHIFQVRHLECTIIGARVTFIFNTTTPRQSLPQRRLELNFMPLTHHQQKLSDFRIIAKKKQ